MKTFKHPRHGEILVTEHVHMLIEKDRRESCPQRTPVWYEKRKSHLTASAIATACGDNPYETRLTLLKKKTGRQQAFMGSAATEHGNKYEFTALLKYEQVTGEKVIEFGLLESVNEGEEFLAGSPDGITASGKLIEIKCPYRRTPNGKVPKHYVHQLQMLMQCLRLPKADFIEFCPETTWRNEIFSIVRVEHDPYWWKLKFPLMKQFWDEVMDVRAAQARGERIDDENSDEEESDEARDDPVIKSGQMLKIHDHTDLDLPEVAKAFEVQQTTTEDPNNWKRLDMFFSRLAEKHSSSSN